MKKKLDVEHLEIGMYITGLDRPWLGTPFLFQGFEIRTEKEIAQLRQFCKYVYIDLDEMNEQSEPTPKGRQPITKGRTSESEGNNTVIDKKIEFELLKQAAAPRMNGKSIYEDKTTLHEEIEHISEVHKETHALIQTIFEDAKMGKSLSADGAKEAVARMAKSVIRNPDALMCFTQLKNKDVYTAEHSMRVCILALAMGRHLDFDEEVLNILGTGALLHDIGKMKVPNEILNKPARLTDAEFTIMRTHVPEGVRILHGTRGIPMDAIDVAQFHHERFDGSGYASGLKGETITQFGQIGAIVDCYDAITSDRAYHLGVSPHAALKNMYEWRKTSFHPLLLEQFIQCMGIYPIGSLVELNTGEVGVIININRTRRLKPQVVLVLKSNNEPYSTNSTIDLSRQMTREGRPYEISSVLEPGTYGINPVMYLPAQPKLAFG